MVLPDLRAHGESDGNKISLGIHEWKDLEAVYDDIEKDYKDPPVGFIGISMGGATSIITVGRTGKGDFILASVPFATYTSQFRFEVRKAGFPRFPFLQIMKLVAHLELGWNYVSHDPLSYIKDINVPVLIFGARHDETVDPNDAKQLFDAAREPKYFWQADCKHDIHKELSEEFEKRMLSFLDNLAQ